MIAPEVEIEQLSDETLVRLAQGCTEWSCIYHGVFNRALHDRGVVRR